MPELNLDLEVKGRSGQSTMADCCWTKSGALSFHPQSVRFLSLDKITFDQVAVRLSMDFQGYLPKQNCIVDFL